MKQLRRHDNILPFYGVSTTVSDFAWRFPGIKMETSWTLRNKPDANRFDLVSTFGQTAYP